MQVRDGMSEVVLTVGPTHTLREAAGMMVEKGTGAALVLDEEIPGSSIITERDILNSVGRGEDPDSELVSAHMADAVCTASPGLEPRARGRGDVAAGDPPPRRRRRRQPRRDALDARHRPGLDLGRRDLGDAGELAGGSFSPWAG